MIGITCHTFQTQMVRRAGPPRVIGLVVCCCQILNGNPVRVGFRRETEMKRETPSRGIQSARQYPIHCSSGGLQTGEPGGQVGAATVVVVIVARDFSQRTAVASINNQTGVEAASFRAHRKVPRHRRGELIPHAASE